MPYDYRWLSPLFYDYDIIDVTDPSLKMNNEENYSYRTKSYG